MGAQPAISVEEYLRTSFPDHDREYRDGELVERALPDYLHAKTQMLLAMFFGLLRERHSIFPCTEIRVKIREGRFLIPDFAVFWRQEPDGIPDAPPLLVVEILSLDDPPTSVRKKLEEYKAWGVTHVWLVDPHVRRMYTCDAGLNEVTSLTIPELGIEVGPAEIFG